MWRDKLSALMRICQERCQRNLRVVGDQINATDLEHAKAKDGQYQTLEESRLALCEDVFPTGVALSLFLKGLLNKGHSHVL